MKNLTFFAPIEKVDEELRMVYGYASTEALDSQGEVVKKDALSGAIEDYMKFANIREMHQPSAVGKAKSAELNEKGMYIAAKIVDDIAWKKVKEGVYNGFSIGGRVEVMKGNEITKLKLSEISIVDRPANPECKFDVFKADDIKPEKKEELKLADALPIEKKEETIMKKTDEIKKEEQVVVAQTVTPPGTQTQVITAEKPPVVVEKPIEVAPVVPEKPVEAAPVETVKPKRKTSKKMIDVKMAKGMFDVSQLAQIIEGLHFIEECVEDEGKWEQDPMDEEYAKKLVEVIKTLGALLSARVDKEVEEMTEEEDAEDKLTPEATVMNYAEQIDGLVKSAKMPEDKLIIDYLTEKKMPTTQKAIDIIKFELAGQILKNVQKAVADKHVEDMNKKPVEKAGKAISSKNESVITEALKQIQAAMEQITKIIPKKEDNARSDDSAGKLTPEEEDKLKNGVKAGSTMTGGGHMVENAEKPTFTKVEQEAQKAHIAKVEGELTLLKEQMAKFMSMAKPVKAKASFVTVEKSIGGDPAMGANVDELAKAEARSNELQLKLKSGIFTQLEKQEADKLGLEILKLRREKGLSK